MCNGGEGGGEDPTPDEPATATITASDVTVEVGKTAEIGATTNSSATITYTSKDATVATVTSAGVVTGVKAGETTITLAVAAVEGKFTAATKDIKVTVKEASTQPVAGKTIAEMKAAYAEAGDMDITLGKVIVTGVDGKTVYAEDETGGVLFYKEDHGMIVGKSYTGIKVTYAELYHTLYEVKGFDLADATIADATVPVTTLNLSDITPETYLQYQSKHVKFTGVTFTAAAAGGKKSTTVKQGNATLDLYIIPTVSITANSVADVTGYVSYYNAPQIAVLDANDINVTQAGTEPTPGGEASYKKVTSVTSGKAYLIVADGHAAKVNTANYGYLQVSDVTDNNGTISSSDETLEYTITSTADGYTIQQSDGRYLYQKGNYNSFNFDAAPTEGQYWTIEAQSDGTFKITNKSVNKYIQYSTSHTSYGSYPEAQSDGVVPTLYEKQ